ncbi:MAG: radical SAM protein [Halodesulfurarchaeum sp.]
MPGGTPATPRITSLSEATLEDRVDALQARYENCDLCGHECGVDRTAGETGVCDLDASVAVASAGPHHGEEPPLRGRNGSGTVFLSACNLHCVFCQNFEISQEGRGRTITAAELGETILDLQARGCHNVNFVSPTHVSPHVVEALQLIRDQLTVPIVWNCGGFERAEVLELLDGIVDIYMPDVKWSSEELAVRYSNAPGYWSHVREALAEMHRQVGDLTVEDGLATGGLLVRHLVMPNHEQNSLDVLTFLANELSRDTSVNVMDQYRPHYEVRGTDQYEEIDRPISTAEYEAVISHGNELGLTRMQYG